VAEPVTFTVPCVAVKERPKRGANGNWYTPNKTRAAEDVVAWYARKYIHGAFVGDVRVTLTFCTDRPIDLDNAIKGTLDGLQRGGAFVNDRQVRVIQAELRAAVRAIDDVTVISIEPHEVAGIDPETCREGRRERSKGVREPHGNVSKRDSDPDA
jgi:Holliday junction resolvase RusA-like endonuclease